MGIFGRGTWNNKLYAEVKDISLYPFCHITGTKRYWWN